jgi:hypothetical protein
VDSARLDARRLLWDSREMFKKELRYAALVAFFLAIVLTGIGGWSNMLGKALVITEQHAWNDGLFLMIVAIFLLLLSIV